MRCSNASRNSECNWQLRHAEGILEAYRIRAECILNDKKMVRVLNVSYTYRTHVTRMLRASHMHVNRMMNTGMKGTIFV